MVVHSAVGTLEPHGIFLVHAVSVWVLGNLFGCLSFWFVCLYLNTFWFVLVAFVSVPRCLFGSKKKCFGLKKQVFAKSHNRPTWCNCLKTLNCLG